MRLLVLAFTALLLAGCQPEPEALLLYDGESVVARGWKGAEPVDGWASVLAVYASEAQGAPPLAGTYKRRGERLTFTPAFTPSPQVGLKIVYRPPGDGIETLRITAKGAPASALTSIERVYPTTDQWPANQLKFYIQFSGPMTKGEAWRRIHLLDEDGAEIEQPFVEIDQELWDPGVTRLTVLFDPGRIKRNLGDTDPPLVPGRKVTLRIDPSWQDARGKPLASGHERQITVIPAVRETVDPGTWKVTAPKGATAPLIIDFPRPLDYALARRTITVSGVEGLATLENNETRWVFSPAKPWKSGPHEIRVDRITEDLAGNRLHRLFDVDVNNPAQTKEPPLYTTLRFVAP